MAYPMPLLWQGVREVIMKRYFFLILVCAFLVVSSVFSLAGELKILTNHLGYEPSGPKHAVVLGKTGDHVSECVLKKDGSDERVASVPVKAAGPVEKWRDWYFWTLDFDSFTTEGKYYLQCSSGAQSVRSFPFHVQSDVIDRNTMSDVIYYFKEERSSGEYDKADRHLEFEGTKQGTVDAHGGWWDATGDYGKHLSHLSFSTYFNPQQIPLVVYSLLKSYEQLKARGVPDFARYEGRLLDEADFGADYLVRVKVPSGSFYRSISSGGVKQVPEERKVAGEMKRFGIYQSSSQEPRDMVEQANSDLEYE